MSRKRKMNESMIRASIRFILFMLIVTVTSCAVLNEIDSVSRNGYEENLSGTYVLDLAAAGNEAEYAPSRFGHIMGSAKIEVEFATNNELVIRDLSAANGSTEHRKTAYFDGKFLKNGVYLYHEKEATGIPLLYRSSRHLYVRFRKSPQTGELTIEVETRSSAQLFLFLANSSGKTTTYCYNATQNRPKQ